MNNQISIKYHQEIKSKSQKPKKYAVILLNDDVTSADFVVAILIDIFLYDTVMAVEKMLQVHNKGRGLCGLYSYDIAITKQRQVKLAAFTKGYPLQCVLEEKL